MIHPSLHACLRCPVEGGPLELADGELIEQMNASIASRDGVLRDWLDQPVTARLDGGLVNQSGSRIYPIRSGIPTLVADQAIHPPE